MFCKQCGRLMKDGAEYCSFCGASLTEEEKEPVQTEQKEYPQAFSAEKREEMDFPDEQEKEDFKIGVGGFLFMLAVMLLLAVMCGIFAGMYFSLSASVPAICAVNFIW